MKKICLFFLILFSLIFINSCNNNLIRNYSVAYHDIGLFGYQEQNILNYDYNVLILSYEHLKTECLKCNYEAFNQNSLIYNTDLSKIIRSYNEDFFLKNCLIMFTYETGEGKKAKLKNIKFKDSTININLKEYGKKSCVSSLVSVYYTMIIEIENKNLDNIKLKIDIG